MDDGKRSSLDATFVRGVQRGIFCFTFRAYSKSMAPAADFLTRERSFPRHHQSKSSFLLFVWFGLTLGHLGSSAGHCGVILRSCWGPSHLQDQPRKPKTAPMYVHMAAKMDDPKFKRSFRACWSPSRSGLQSVGTTFGSKFEFVESKLSSA